MKVAGCELNAYEPHAAMDVRRWFDLNRQVKKYLEWYHGITERWSVEDSTLPLVKAQ